MSWIKINKPFKMQIDLAVPQEKSSAQKIKEILDQKVSLIQNLIQSGEFKINQKAKKQIINRKQDQKYTKQMNYLSQQIQKNDYQYKKAKLQLLKQKKLQAQKSKQQNQLKKKQIEQKIKKWGTQQKQIKRKYQQNQQAQRLKQIQQQQRLRKSQEQKIQTLRLEKQKQISKKLRQIEDNRQERQQIFRQSNNPLNPKYLQMQKNYKIFQQQKIFQAELIKKNHRLRQKIDHEAINNHQKIYLQKIEGRKAQKNLYESKNQTKQGFSTYLSRDQQKIAQAKQKLKKRKQFQKKVKQIPIEIDEAKKVKIQIALDRAKNPLKYNFLGQKALNQFQIYGQFQDFQVNTSAKDLGKQYLRSLPQINQKSRVTKVESTTVLSSESGKIKYRDYLKQIREKQQSKSSRVKSISLSQQSKRYQLQALKRKQQISKTKGYKSSFKLKQDADEMYIKSIKAKLACLKVQTDSQLQ